MNFSEELAVAGALELTDSELEMIQGGDLPSGPVNADTGPEHGERGDRGDRFRGDRFRGEGFGGEGFGFDYYPWGWPEYYEQPFPWWLRRRYRDRW